MSLWPPSNPVPWLRKTVEDSYQGQTVHSALDWDQAARGTQVTGHTGLEPINSWPELDHLATPAR